MGKIDVEVYQMLSKPPASALKTIGFGALKGKSDISPQWKIRAMTEVFGLCGFGWKFSVIERWQERGDDGILMVFVRVSLMVNLGGEWSEPIEGVGGNSIVDLARGEKKSNDEGWKMATTDALGNAMKYIGVAGDIFEGSWDGSKYNTLPPAVVKKPVFTVDKLETAIAYADRKGLTFDQFISEVRSKYDLTADMCNEIVKYYADKEARV